jgi:VWFA-related protein
LIDDGAMLHIRGVSGENEPWSTQKVKRLARLAVEELAPGDLGALLYSSQDRQFSQGLTTEREKLIDAISKSNLVGVATSSEDPAGDERGQCVCGLCSIEALEEAVALLAASGESIRMIVTLGPGVYVRQTAPWTDCNQARQRAMTKVFHEAQAANVTIYSVDSNGLLPSERPGSPDVRRTELRNYLRSMAENTGGVAIVNTNGQEDYIPAFFRESSAVYELGVAALHPADGKFHRLTVRVNRPGVTVQARKGYYGLAAPRLPPGTER